ncbi:radical SAM/SPASM domain-containing protein [Helicobacter jaachi]|uniref:Radical SAM/SPASM domain-containing protein n=1 Tax=Helicobacter jaachi TaxID=1677920 RepID=A0A4U8T7V1_9HELI|nr:radical SAM/SPASM domain-containing protein [Helicobacter jaachi]TLD95750.1 radical SAM/SPASM domain-containing protein [Helicobacter jaachi]
MKQFQKIYVEITDYCALNCGFCPSGGRKSRRGQMDLELFRQICTQIQGKTKRVCLHILGDPLSARDFEHYAKTLAHFGLKVELVTTGLFLHKQHFAMLSRPPFVQVCFSLSAFVANPCVLTMQHLEQILYFCAFNLEQNSPIFINLRLHEGDMHKPLAQDILARIYRFFHVREDEMTQGRIRLGKKVLLIFTRVFEWEQVFEKERRDMANVRALKVYKAKARETKQPLQESKPFSKTQDSILCYGASGQIGILSNGELVPCCIDYEGRASFGNVRERDIKSMLDSINFRHFASMLKQGKAPCELCQKCGYKYILG